jgi:SOS-response transcriptional repressor LexA|tara:strand:+ start:108 stop:338 length:231 start_codon:yes stop_codon:yes gene_type:complete
MEKKTKLVYDFIVACQQIRKVTPTYKEIAVGLGMRSKSNIFRYIRRLEKMGAIEMQPKKMRTIRLTNRVVNEITKL